LAHVGRHASLTCRGQPRAQGEGSRRGGEGTRNCSGGWLNHAGLLRKRGSSRSWTAVSGSGRADSSRLQLTRTAPGNGDVSKGPSNPGRSSWWPAARPVSSLPGRLREHLGGPPRSYAGCGGAHASIARKATTPQGTPSLPFAFEVAIEEGASPFGQDRAAGHSTRQRPQRIERVVAVPDINADVAQPVVGPEAIEAVLVDRGLVDLETEQASGAQEMWDASVGQLPVLLEPADARVSGAWPDVGVPRSRSSCPVGSGSSSSLRSKRVRVRHHPGWSRRS
jgi:hypothetical protein